MPHIIINIGRQLGSGGHDIGSKLAKEFGATYYDRELLNLAAKESGFSEEFFERNDERKGFLKSLFHMRMPHVSDVNFYLSDFSQEGLFRLQSQAIRKAASQGPCVFVGRCADYILRDMPMTTNVFITASTDFRIQQLMSKLQCTADEARHKIESGEKARASYYNYYTGKHWGAAESYDLCVCSSTLGLEQTASLIATYIRQRFSLN